MMERGEELMRDNEERVFVSVRLRPLDEKEISSNDVSDWECINSDTIVYKDASLLTSQRLKYPTAYTFDRVFRSDSSTRTVYEQGAKDVAISVVRGVNSTVFAYGQTSSGKTYTMTGITEYAIADIYDYIHKHPEREFTLKFSAMEIYDESVWDLLSAESAPLRLLDDPERGTIVVSLTEEILRDRDHLTELLFVCEAQRKTEETSLNDLSSRSHQIIQLTIESSPREFLGRYNPSTLSASVNFVDLAGSERAFQSLSAHTGSKEGCRSLLTLRTVIRKLSKERNGHIPYRDSMLTRILQTSLGGNARTAIICTMSPARSHVEQSRNTLLFASCAKEVTSNANVNIVMSDKALVKHLQKQLARLEDELRSSQPSFTSLNYSALLREKDAQIKKLEMEIKDLILQRDTFASRVKELSLMLGDDASSITQVGLRHYPHLHVSESPNTYIQEQENSTCSDELSRSSSRYHIARIQYFDENFEHSNASPSIIPGSSSFSESDSFYGWQEIEKQMNGNLEDLCNEVHRIETEHSRNREPDYSYSEDDSQFTAIKVHADRDGQPPLVKDQGFPSPPTKDDNEEKEDIWSGMMPLNEGKELISASVKEGEESTSPMPAKEGDFSSIQYPVNASLQKLCTTHNRAEDLFVSRCLRVARSKSCHAGIFTYSASPWFKMTDSSENTPLVGSEKESEGCGRNVCKINFSSGVERLSGNDCQSRPENALDMEIYPIADKFLTAEDSTSSTPHMMAKADLPTQQEITVKPEEEAPKFNESPKRNMKLDPKQDGIRHLTSWPVEFKTLQRKIVELWHACNISLVHRTYFFLLFQGDPSDAIYLEVEIRRMKLLKDKFSRGDKIIVDGHRLSLSSSAKALRQERRMLSEQMMKKFSEQERERLFVAWGIGLNTKLRRLQLAHRVWSRTEDINHIADSAFLVAKLVGFIEPGSTPTRDMFGVNLTPKCSTGICTFKRSLGSLL